MNAIGLLAVAGFLIGCLGALIAALALHRVTSQSADGYRTWDKNDPEAQNRFRIFIGFCAFGVLSCVAGFVVGDWPQG